MSEAPLYAAWGRGLGVTVKAFGVRGWSVAWGFETRYFMYASNG